MNPMVDEELWDVKKAIHRINTLGRGDIYGIKFQLTLEDRLRLNPLLGHLEEREHYLMVHVGLGNRYPNGTHNLIQQVNAICDEIEAKYKEPEEPPADVKVVNHIFWFLFGAGFGAIVTIGIWFAN